MFCEELKQNHCVSSIDGNPAFLWVDAKIVL